jgi:hypothetical protein
MRTGLLALSALTLAACGGQDPGIDSSRLPACGTTPAPALFEHALCLCEDFLDVGLARIGPGRDPASIAVNGRSASVSRTVIEGDFIAHGGLDAVADFEVRGNLASSEDIDWVGLLRVDGDLSAGGDVRGVGSLEVEGNVAIGGRRGTIGLESVGGNASYVAPAGPPCNCDPSTFLDIPAMVALARTDNDNDARGIDPERIVAIGDVKLELTTGRYYFSDVATIGRARLVIDGAVSIYLDGDLAAIGDGRIELSPGSSLDMYVSGNVATVGKIALGDPSDPSAFRLYIGGARPVKVAVGLTEIAGSIYAPQAEILWVGATALDGALFARDLAGVGLLDINYTRPVAVDVEPDECPPPANPSSTPPVVGNTAGTPSPSGPDV